MEADALSRFGLLRPGDRVLCLGTTYVVTAAHVD